MPMNDGSVPKRDRGARLRLPLWLAAGVAAAAIGTWYVNERLGPTVAMLEARLANGEPARLPFAAGLDVQPARLGTESLPAFEPEFPAPGTVAAADASETHEASGRASGDVNAAAAAAADAASPAQPSLAFAEASLTVREVAGVARLVLRRESAGAAPDRVVWWTEPGTAAAGEDYADLGRLEEAFAAGAAELALLVPITSDAVPESAETFRVRVVDAARESDVARATRTATITIVDDD